MNNLTTFLSLCFWFLLGTLSFLLYECTRKNHVPPTPDCAEFIYCKGRSGEWSGCRIRTEDIHVDDNFWGKRTTFLDAKGKPAKEVHGENWSGGPGPACVFDDQAHTWVPLR